MKRQLGTLFFGAGVVASLAMGWVAFPMALYRSEAQPLRFNHQVHTGDSVGIACEGCHPIDADHRFAEIPTVAQCAECHSDPIGESPNEKILVEEYVRKGREVPWLRYSEQPDHVNFSHPMHVKLVGLSCERCHGIHGKTDAPPPHEENRLTGYSRLIWGHSISRFGREPWEGKKMSSDCHRDSEVVESCIDCHK